jgi:hypothetical protein
VVACLLLLSPGYAFCYASPAVLRRRTGRCVCFLHGDQNRTPSLIIDYNLAVKLISKRVGAGPGPPRIFLRIGQIDLLGFPPRSHRVITIHQAARRCQGPARLRFRKLAILLPAGKQAQGANAAPHADLAVHQAWDIS